MGNYRAHPQVLVMPSVQMSGHADISSACQHIIIVSRCVEVPCLFQPMQNHQRSISTWVHGPYGPPMQGSTGSSCIKSLTILFNVALPQTHAVVSDLRLTAIELQLAGISLLWASSFGGMASPKISTGSNFVELGCGVLPRCISVAQMMCHATPKTFLLLLPSMA